MKTPTSSSNNTSLTSSPADSATLFLRLFAGLLLFSQVITKSQNYPYLASEYPTILGVDGATIVSTAGIVELIAGALLTTGLLTRVASCVMAVMMAGAAFLYFPLQSFDQAELKVVYCGIYLTLAIGGGGRYSLDAFFRALRKMRTRME